MSKTLRTRVALGLVMASFTLLSAGMPGYILPAYGQAQPELKNISPQFVTEPGCPVEVIQATTQLEMDPFGTPMAARHYIDYRNSSGQPVAAVKFRIGYVADDGKIHQPYLNAPDAHVLGPGEQASQKWRGDRVDPRTQVVKIRVLMVKMADGSIWESQKARESASGAGAQNEGFVPLQNEVPGGAGDIASGDLPRVPGTPVPLTDTAKQYTQYPQQTTTGTVPFKQVQTPAAGFEQNAFGGGAVPTTTAAPGGFAPFSGANAPPAGAATAAPAAGTWGDSAGAPVGGAPPAGFGSAPTATAPVVPAATAPAPVATPAAPAVDVDPVASLDALLGNPKTKPTTPPAPAAPATAPVAPATAPAAPATAPVAPATAPAAPATAPPAVAPETAAPATAPAQAAPAEAAPAQAAPDSAADSFSGSN